MDRYCRKALFGAALAASCGPVWSAGTPAGTPIPNTAIVTYFAAAVPRSATSNTDILLVDERLDVSVVSNDLANVSVSSPDSNAQLSFTVTNIGNGREPLELVVEVVAGDDFDPTNRRIYLDDGDGVFDSDDVLYLFNGNDPVLDPDGAVVVFIVSDIPAGLSDGGVGSLGLRATAVTAGAGGNPAGTVFPGAGDNGVDALTGFSTATALAQGNYIAAQVNASLMKSQTVANPGGGTAPSPGAVVTYRLTLTVASGPALDNARITDAIPSGTSYVADSITLDSGGGAVTLSDAVDADVGRLDTGANPDRIEVQLGTVPAGATRVVTFQVTVN